MIEDFKKLSTFWKALVILGLPLLILLIFTGGGDYIRAWINDRQRKKTDDASAALDEKNKQTDLQIAHQQGKVDQLQKEKEDAISQAGNQNSTDFHNSRKPTDS